MGLEKEINLIPGSKGIEFKSLQPLVKIIAGFVLLAVIFVITGAMQQRKINDIYDESARVKEEIASFNYLNENVKIIEEKRSELQKRQDTISIVEKEKVKVLGFLNKLKSYVPANVRIVSLSITNGENVAISFETASTYDVARLMVKLEEMDAFEKVETGSLPIDDKINTITFNLKLKKNSEQVSKK